MTGWETSEASPLQSRGFVFSAAGVGLLMLAAVFLIVATIAGRHAPSARQMALGSHAGGATPATGGRPSAAGGGAVSVDDPRGCSLSAGSQLVPVSAPVSGWGLVGSMAAPTAPSTLGPQKSIDGLRVCFAHSPTGALFAAASFWAEATVVPQTLLYGRLAADTPARAVAVAQAQGSTQRLQDIDGDPGTVSIAGFQYTAYTPAEADLSIVLSGPRGEQVSLPCSMLWQDGDWRLVIPPSQQLAAAAVTSMDHFVSWAVGQ
jgi:hypothetical protein